MIYLDNAATTKTAPEVVDAMLPYFSEYYGNASTIYSLGAESKKAMDHARQTIADSLGAKPEEIYFTAGGSESDNWALKATEKPMLPRENISLPRRSSIMPFFIPVSIWRSEALRSLI